MFNMSIEAIDIHEDGIPKEVLDILLKNHTTSVVLLLSFLFVVVLQKELTAYYASTALQSLRHGFAVPPPFTQGRLWCVRNC